MDLVKAEDGVETAATQNDGEAAGVDLAELQARIAIAESAAQAVLDALKAASDLAPEDPATLDPDAPATLAIFASARSALAAAYALGWRSATAERRRAGGGRDERRAGRGRRQRRRARSAEFARCTARSRVGSPRRRRSRSRPASAASSCSRSAASAP